MKHYLSWNLYPKHKPRRVIPLFWIDDLSKLLWDEGTYLPYGLGKSYGDVCLNKDGILLDTSFANRFICFDEKAGIICCESGTSLCQVLDLVTKFGWFLPVVPGTELITIGGAIANDVHGKNHHKSGSFGNHLLRFELVRSNGERFICSEQDNSELFYATIGGLGLTGLITWAELKLIKIPSRFLMVESIRFSGIEEYLDLEFQSEKDYDFTVSWLDFSLHMTNNFRGIFQRANFAEKEKNFEHKNYSIQIPMIERVNLCLINKATTSLFNMFYYYSHLPKSQTKLVFYKDFLFPLDKIKNWNRVYGSRGFVQYQFVIPSDDAQKKLNIIFTEMKKLGLFSFLTVLKKFGNVKSKGFISFPISGITMAIDFPMSNDLFKKLDRIDAIIKEFEGRLYPAKDTRMSKEFFWQSYPMLKKFIELKDPKFSSSFWRRVTE